MLQMLIELTPEEFELIETSVVKRLETWCWTLGYLETRQGGAADRRVPQGVRSTMGDFPVFAAGR